MIALVELIEVGLFAENAVGKGRSMRANDPLGTREHLYEVAVTHRVGIEEFKSSRLQHCSVT